MVNQDGENILVEHLGNILAYYSIAGPRTDFPRTVVPLYPMKLNST
uniref:Uncharacterized protein n=1 Tax=Rhizophora mucronata TaxID=61149 RepID=A0A2P2QRK6_RHIMU